MMNVIKHQFRLLKNNYPIILAMTIVSVVFVIFFSSSSGASGNFQLDIAVQSDDAAMTTLLKSEPFQSAEDYKLSFVDDAKAALQDDIDFAYHITAAGEIIKYVSRQSLDAQPKIMTFEWNLRGKLSDQGLFQGIASAVNQLGASSSAADVDAYFQSESARGITMMSVEPEMIESADSLVSFDGAIHSLVGMALMFAMYTLFFGLSDMVIGKRARTWQRGMISPMSVTDMVLGSLFTSFLVGSIQIILVFIIGRFVLGIDMGTANYPYIAIIVFAFSFAVIGIVSIVAALVKTMQQMGTLAPIVITSTAMLGGCMWPLQIVENPVIRFLGNLTPQKWAIEGIENLAMYQKGVTSIILPLVILIAIGIVATAIGVFLQRRQQLSY